MSFIDKYSSAFRYLLPNPLTIALLLTIFTFSLAYFWPSNNEGFHVSLTTNDNVNVAVANKSVSWSNGTTSESIAVTKADYLNINGIYKNTKNGYNTTIRFDLNEKNKLISIVESKPKIIQLFFFLVQRSLGKGRINFCTSNDVNASSWTCSRSKQTC
jgi:hypothetical protein